MSDNCLFSEFFSKFDCRNKLSFQKTITEEETGKFSRCLIVETPQGNQSGCFFTSCQGNVLFFTVQGQEYSCKDKGQKFSTHDYSIVCPDPVDFCARLADECKEDCNANGECLLDKSCRCHYFYQGSTCAQKGGCDANDQNICSQLEGVAASERMFDFLIVSFLVIFS